MSGELQEQARLLFLRILDMEPEAAHLLLDDERRRRPEVVAEVESLLGSESEGARLFASGSLGPSRGDEPGLEPGAAVLHYRLLEKVGTGMTGAVWKAEDLRLRRTVALKILGGSQGKDPETLARFRKEARVLAHLTHPGLAAIHAVEEWDGRPLLALEFVPGPTLAERIGEGPLPVAEALPLAHRLAEALESAHDAGVIHRDLKPANIKLPPGGGVKILDFGLAKGFGPAIQVTESESLLAAFEGTIQGTILGTASYMSPEQARGEALDAGTDLWSFGCVLYEMLTGRQAFSGRTLSDTIAAVLQREPDWSRLPADTPPRIRRLLSWCLRKDAAGRLACAADAASEIALALDPDRPADRPEDIGPLPSSTPRIGRIRSALVRLTAGIVAGAAVGLLIWALLGHGLRPVRPDVPSRVLPLPLSASASAMPGAGAGLAFDAAGEILLYRGRGETGPALFIRHLDRLKPEMLPGTEGAMDGLLTGSGSWVLMQVRGAWWRLPRAGGVPTRLVAATGPGADWADGRLVFTPSFRSGLALAGGRGGPRMLTRPNPGRGEIAHRWPAFSPDGEHVAFTIIREGGAGRPGAELALVAARGGPVQPLEMAGTCPRFQDDQSLLFVRDGRLLAVDIDLASGAAIGAERLIAGQVAEDPLTGAAHYAASRQGMVALASGTVQPPAVSLLSLSRDGGTATRMLTLPAVRQAVLARSGQIAAVSVDGEARLLAAASEQARLEPVAHVKGVTGRPVWFPDGRRLAVAVEGPDGTALLLARADGQDPPRTLLPPGPERWPEAFTSDGAALVFTQRSPAGDLDLMSLALGGEAEPVPLRHTVFDERAGRPSPDGVWLAYVSGESGRDEVYLRRAGESGERVQISRQGGCCPAWSADSGLLWYLQGLKVMTVSLPAGGGLSASPVRAVGEVPDGDILDAVEIDGDLWLVQREPRASWQSLTLLTGLLPAGGRP